ncbi:phage virion morphogenesis protein [Mariprofundus ferrooxydans]|uniref:Possible bacteriophage Mu G-like protein n=1 Tax=Mariprofundus ferrooxydans PV-1 TaxID=314345 RepID=Q0EWD6_9PROT|nr:phage virion morphogenesis protein [Mariprofundus ferrooxydans]EAU53535.1 possible bacteriophage Mu G-like protein [Mariprofundus ferrooxydans PV-1]KON47015.1 hypothetical protein AL013_10515 [Mariprofundus ferrooxydans]
MAGASEIISIEYDDKAITEALERLQKATGDLEPAFIDIGEHLLESTQQHFADQVDPDGNPWAELTDATKARKKKNADKILIGEGDLMGFMRYNADHNGLAFGSDRIYAAMQQFGGETAANSAIPGKTIPARPFLGISADDEQAIIGIVSHYLSGVIS